MTKLGRAVSFLVLIGAGTALAQSWDTSGNSKLNGSFFFRQVLYAVADQYGDIGEAAALYGTISFHGDGTYSIAASTVNYIDSGAGSGILPAESGTYSISASGYGFISNPFVTGDFIYGSVSNGVFVGSSTDNAGGYNDFFVAAASSGATAASFNGSYSLAYMTFPFNMGYGDPAYVYDVLATLNPNGLGSAGTMNVTGYSASNGSTPITRSVANVQYRFGSGIGTLIVPNTSSSPSGIPNTMSFYISADGNFIFGGSTNSWDMFVGVRNGSGTPNGLYYQAGMLDDASQVPSSDSSVLSTYFGSLKTGSGGTIAAHQRFFEPIFYGNRDYTYGDSFPAGTPGGYTDSKTSTQYAISSDGGYIVGLGIGPQLGIQVAVRAPNFSGSGVFLDPTGVQNAASFAPFTASVSRGELLFLTGSGFADQFEAASIYSPFPKTLRGVQVLVNGTAAAIYYVGPTYIAALVPYATASGVATIQVVTAQGSSNTITVFVGSTSPGVYVANGYAIAQHSDYSLVTAGNPAHPGDVLLIYMTGLGDVAPAIGDGALGPAMPVSTSTNTFTATIGGVSAAVAVTEIVPTIAGDYVLALTVPSGVASGDQTLIVSGPDSINSTALLPIAAQ